MALRVVVLYRKVEKWAEYQNGRIQPRLYSLDPFQATSLFPPLLLFARGSYRKFPVITKDFIFGNGDHLFLHQLYSFIGKKEDCDKTFECRAAYVFTFK